MNEPFADRQEAGRELGHLLIGYKDSNALVLAIPRGGVVVGYEVARMLNSGLDVIVPRKIRAPQQEELAIGAVACWGDHESIIDERSVSYLGVTEEYIEREAEHQLAEVNRRLVAYRGTANPPEVAGRTVILVDDGIATGYTMRAAVLALRRLGTDKLVVAVPVGPRETIEELRTEADEVVCPRTPSPFLAVGYWYRMFDQVPDAEVVLLLQKSREWD